MVTASGSADSHEPGGGRNSRTVFVVHGRNEQLRKSMFEFLRSINLSPLEWTQAVDLTGEGSPYIGDVLDCAFDHAQAVVVLLTPDEIAYLQPRYGDGTGDPETQPAAQARPNVLFEAGMALGREAARTVIVEVGDVRPFSDLAGRHTIRMKDDVASRQALAARLRKTGCEVNLTGTDWHGSGDFTPPTPPGDGLALGRRVPSTPGREAVRFDAKYYAKGGKSMGGSLQIINRGVETVYDVTVSLPDGAVLRLVEPKFPIAKIPGGGKSVTLPTLNPFGRRLGGTDGLEVFDLTVTGRTEAGEPVVQEVFLDTNG